MFGPNQKNEGREQQLTSALEERLKMAEQRFHTVVEGARGIIYIAELGPQGRWTFVSPQITSILGFTPEEWMSDPDMWARQVHPDDREAVLREERQLSSYAPGLLHASEYRLLTRSGEVRWVTDAATIVADTNGKLVWSGVITDITERYRAQQELRASEERLRNVIETASDAFVGMDADGRIVEWNRAAERLFGWNRTEVLGLSVTETIIPERYRPSHNRGMATLLRTGHGPIMGRTVLLSALTRAGKEFPIELSVWSGSVDGVSSFNAFIRDITERKALQEVTHQALHDPLTDLPNRVLFMDRVEHALSRRGNLVRSSAVLLLDLDDFKTVNDSLGHIAGDQLLIEVAARLSKSLRPADTLSRLAGDEFAILLEDLTDASAAQVIATRIIQDLQRAIEIESIEVFVHASIGIALSDAHTARPEDLMRDADVAMYEAKARGKGGFAVFEPRMRAAVVNRLELKGDLRRALERSDFLVHYQPCVRLSDFSIVGAEALIRWNHADRGLIPPLDFIPLAEEMGLIVPMGRWVLRHSCEQGGAWARRWSDIARITLSVNLSGRQLQDPELVSDVSAGISSSGFPAEQLVLEITESCLVEDPEYAVKKLCQLKDLGIRLAIDDFGTGYSSLSYLQRFPIDILKIDRSFVAGLGKGTENAAMARAILQLARNLGMETIAEGVEDASQIEALRKLGCRFAQGFHFSKPVPENEFETMLQAQVARNNGSPGPGSVGAVGPTHRPRKAASESPRHHPRAPRPPGSVRR